MARLLEDYKSTIIDKVVKDLGYKNKLAAPKLEKVVINFGVGSASQDKKKIEKAVEELALISGQKPVITLSKNAIAGFRLREGVPVGCKVTLRKKRMYEFVDRLINIVLPRVKDFRGLKADSFDGNGNYSFGLKEQLVFPEINYDTIDVVRGMDIVVCTTAKTDEEAKKLLQEFKFPFMK